MSALIHASHFISAIAGPISKSLSDVLTYRAEIRRIDAQVKRADAEHRIKRERLKAEAAGFDAQMRFAGETLEASYRTQMAALQVQRERCQGALLLMSQNSRQLHIERRDFASARKHIVACLVSPDTPQAEKDIMRGALVDLGAQMIEMQRMTSSNLNALIHALPSIEPPRALLSLPSHD